MDPQIVVIAAGLVLLGAVAQRVAGLGFAMLSSPFLVLLLGPHEGVLLVNICGVVSSLLITPRVWKDINWTAFRWLTAFSIVGSVVGALIATRLDSAVLSLTVGVIVLIALLLSVGLSRANVAVGGSSLRAAAGALSGLTNSMAGVGGPAVSAYAVLTRWDQRTFAATVQPFFAVIGTVAVVSKVLIAPDQQLVLPWWDWGLFVLAIAVGIFGGERLQRFVRDHHARAFILAIAFGGALAAVAKGWVGLAA
ncbi:sulfite exporter TauE/SafE family protein [Arthrobacter sp. JSM 101049]|uniref:sulfite exporter TauE/SafE family protein n=1 Tax=Arthrobacter sp. JSM 101049 TaxID=929097 RepID=UPI003569C128